MRVLHVIDSFNRGGAETLALDMLKKARDHGIEMSILSTGTGELLEEFRAIASNIASVTRKLPVDVAVAGAIREFVKEKEIQIVHCHQPVEGIHAFIGTIGLDVRRVLTVHGSAFDKRNRLALRFLAPRMHTNIAVSNAQLDILLGKRYIRSRDNWQVVYNGVDAAKLSCTSRQLRIELGLQREELLLGMIANFVRGKDPLTVCHALPHVFRQFPKTQFAFVGTWNEGARHLYDECVKQCESEGIAGRVHFLGRRRDIADVLASMDIFLLSSIEDTFGLAAVEAMLVGVPTVLSDIASFREISGEGSAASLFRTGDPLDLALKLAHLVQHAGERAALSKRAKTWALSRFTIGEHILELKKVYEGLLIAMSH